ncbi:MAG TPA: LysR family transcriptional regulator [Luteimonas sp.]|nr:LysR family transcriptional regulator [Luteimonas sp.]
MARPQLADLDAFADVARARSFRGAAYLRGVSASTLSEAVRRLEARLGVRLLNRSTRSVTPTEAGARLLERLDPALADVASALDAIHATDAEPAGTLRLNVPTIAARLILPPLLSRFLQAHPRVRVEVVAQDTFIDVLAAGFDAGIRYEERLEADMIAVPVGPRTQRFVVAGAPAWFARHGRPSHPRQIDPAHCIGHRFASGLTATWEFERGVERFRLAPAGRVVATTLELELRAAVDGLGLIASFEDLLRPALEAGRLEAVLDDWCPPFPGPSLYYPSRRQMPAALRAFVDFLHAEAA